MKVQSLIVVVIMSIFLTGCSSKKNDKADTKTLYLNFAKLPPTLDTRKVFDPVASTMLFMLYEGITRITPSSTSSLGLASDIALSDDKMTYTITLRDAKWSNGQPITAKHIERTWKTNLSPNFACPNAHLLYAIKNAEKAKSGEADVGSVGVKAVDDKTLIIELERPTPYFLELTSFCALFPIYYPEDRPLNEAWADSLSEDFVTSGPFRLAKWDYGKEMVLEKNPYYLHKDEVHLDKIIISFVQDELTAYNLFEQGQIDVIGAYFSDIPDDLIEMLNKQNRISSAPIAATKYLAFNTTQFPFNNINVRKAITYAINREELTKFVTGFNEKIADSYVPTIFKVNYKEKDLYDPELASQLLDQGLKELGISHIDFPPIVYSYMHTRTDKKLAQAIQHQIEKNLGLRVKLDTNELKPFFEKISSKKHSIAQCQSIAQFFDPMDLLGRYKYRGGPKNFSSWQRGEYIKKLNDSSYTETERARFAAMKKAESIMSEDLPLCPLYHHKLQYMTQSRVKNFYVSPIGSVHIEWIEK